MRVKGPGPKYALPTTTGVTGHDPTRTQAPAFSFGVLTKGAKIKPSAPGPKYNISNMNNHGKLLSQQAPLLGRWKPSKYNCTPGPKLYDPAVIEPSYPAYTFGNKRPDLRKLKVGPGPNKYAPPTCIGPQIPDKKAEPAYSILSRNFTQNKQRTPGPKYGLPEPNTYFKTPPRVAVLGRRKQNYGTGVPGPKYKPIPTYNKPEGLKGVSFGVKHSPEKHLVYLPEDKNQDAFVF